MSIGNNTFKTLSHLSLMICAIGGGQAQAQTDEKKSSWALEEIVVTAQKKMASINDVPVSITAVDASDIRELRITESTDIAAYVPNVDIKGTLAGGNPAITLRGVGLNDFNANNNPSVGVYVDEVFMASPGLLTFSTFDIERIEVLKGPQGTLYGRNTNGGAINFFTTKPNGEEGGYINATAGNYEVLELEAAYGNAINELWSYRVSSMIQTQGENYGDNKYVGGDDFGDTERYAIRAQFGYESDDLIANIALTYGSENLGFTPFKTKGTLDPATIANPVPSSCVDFSNQALCSNVAGEQYLDGDEDRYYYSPNIPQDDSEADTLITVLSLEKILSDDRSLYSITSFSDVDREYVDAIYESPQFGLRYFDGIHDEDISQLSQEFRLTTSAEQYDWNVGIFLSTDDVDSSTLFNSEAALTQIDVTYEQTTDALAAFSHIDYAVNDDFSVELGIRYSWEERDYKGGTIDLNPFDCSAILDPTFGCAVAGPVDFTASTDYKFDDENVSGKLGANYHPTEDLMLYGSISTGFKSGIVFADLTFDPSEEGPLEPEEIVSYEIGAKSTLLDNTLQVNASLFYYDYQDIQTLVLSNLSLKFVNADEAEVKGGEVEFTWRPLEGLDIRGGVGFLDTEITDDVNLEGNELPNSPDLQYLGVVRYTFFLDGGMELLLQGDFKYSDEMYKDAINLEETKSDDYTIYNARVALSMPDAGWEVSAWGKNVTDERYQEHIFNGIFFGATNELYNPPATYGVSVNYDF